MGFASELGIDVGIGGVLVAQYLKKRAAGPKCGDCKQSLKGVCSNTMYISKRMLIVSLDQTFAPKRI